MDIIKRLNCIITTYRDQVYFMACRESIVKSRDFFDQAKQMFGELRSNEDEYIDFSIEDIEAHQIFKRINKIEGDK